jgi:hypothetical protein
MTTPQRRRNFVRVTGTVINTVYVENIRDSMVYIAQSSNVVALPNLIFDETSLAPLVDQKRSLRARHTVVCLSGRLLRPKEALPL